MLQETTERGLWITNAIEVTLVEPADVINLMNTGNHNRIVAATSMSLSIYYNINNK